MATAVQDILRRVRFLIVDFNNIRWTDDELVLWLNDAQSDILVFKPDANTVRATLSCAAGTRQTLPAGAIQLLDVPRNSAGAMRAIRPVARRVLDLEDPNWHSGAQQTAAKYFVYDPNRPAEFYVYPPVQAAVGVEVLYSAKPDPITINDDITLDDIYVGPIVDYICYRAFSKDADFAPSRERADLHFKAYMAAVTGKQITEDTAVPAPVTGENDNAV